MKLIIFLAVMFVIFLVAKLTTGFYVETVPLLQAYQPALLWLTVGSGVLLGLCIAIKIIKEIKETFKHGKDKEE